ncbi:CS1 fimbrial subunit B flags: Precursor [Stenotrophomonas sp. NPDC077659]|uniref:CS1 fimbrial subunit B flags: Precursor n=1 Tax=Stenotrophomonas sp. NPDC077659 TaxID=3390694 RepID=UPI003CFE9188
MRILLMLMLWGAAFNGFAGQPQINVGPLFDYLPAGSGNLLKRIRNTGDGTAYVRVEVTRMQFDAQGQSAEVPVDATAIARNAAGAQGVIASPSRLIIAANGQQATRLVYRGARDQEQYYRLRFVPVAPTAEEFSLSEEEARAVTGVQSAIQVFTGFGTILFISPDNPQYDTRIDGDALHNQGNATIVLDNLRYCERANPDSCSAGILVHIRPGRSHALDMSPTQFSRYDLREGDARRSIDTRR